MNYQLLLNVTLALAVSLILWSMKYNEKRLRLIEAEMNGWKEKNN